MKTVFLPVTEKGLCLSRKIACKLEGSIVRTPEAVKKAGLKKLVKKEFAGADALVFVSAVGIAVRSIAPLLKDKAVDPAVVVLDEKGKFAISLVSGHLGGANRLARKISSIIGSVPVITTATDLHNLPCAEEIAEKTGSAIENPKMIKRINSAILKKERISVFCDDSKRLSSLKGFYKKHDFLSFKKGSPQSHAYHSICISSRNNAHKNALLLRPKELVIGIGCGKGVKAGIILNELKKSFKENGLSLLSIRNLATIDMKKNEPGIKRLSKELGCEVEYYSPDELGKRGGDFKNSSVFVLETTGAPGVSEPAALISAKTNKLLMRKRCARRTALAIAKAR